MNLDMRDQSVQGRRPGLALFDFDGTLTTCETFPLFIRKAVSRRRLWAGWLRLWPAVLGYRLGWVSGVRLRADIVRMGLAGVSVEALRCAGARFARETLPWLLRPHAMQRLEWHRQRGDRVIVVSGGLGCYLRPWADALNLQLICSELEHIEGRCSGRYLGPQCVGAAKVDAVLLSCDLKDFSRIYAYGDTPEDHALLELADEPIYRWRPWRGDAHIHSESPRPCLERAE